MIEIDRTDFLITIFCFNSVPHAVIRSYIGVYTLNGCRQERLKEKNHLPSD